MQHPTTDSDAMTLFLTLTLSVPDVTIEERISFALMLGVYYGCYKAQVVEHNNGEEEETMVCAAYHMTLAKSKKIFEERNAELKEKEEKQ